MTRKATLTALWFSFIASASAQTPIHPVAVEGDKGVVYATHAVKPNYPYFARSRHMVGTGVFLIHIRADGTVQSVKTMQSTGHPELDDSARSAFLQWRFRPGPPTKLKMPITFSMHRPHNGI